MISQSIFLLKRWSLNNIGLIYGALSVISIYLINLSFISLATNNEVISLYKFLVIASWINVISNLGKNSIMIVRQKNKQDLMLSDTLIKQAIITIILYFLLIYLNILNNLIDPLTVLIYLVVFRIQDTLAQISILRLATNTYFLNYHFLKSLIWLISYFLLINYFDSPILSFVYSFIIASILSSMRLIYLSSKSIYVNNGYTDDNTKGNFVHMAYWFDNIASATIATIANLAINQVSDTVLIATFYIAMRLSSVFDQINTYLGNRSQHFQANNHVHIREHILKTTSKSLLLSIVISISAIFLVYLSGYIEVLLKQTNISYLFLFTMIYLISTPIKCLSAIIEIYFTTKNKYKILYQSMMLAFVMTICLYSVFYFTSQWYIIFIILLTIPFSRIIFYYRKA